jgi:signal transduction histidine kinase/DNA-binding response OmpR family regulator
MNSPLRVLHLEDDVRDTELLQATLEAEGVPSELTRVETEHDFGAALKRGKLDLILADYTLPSFDGVSALRLAQEHAPDVPFLFVSGTLGEDVAIEALKKGATDYVLKTRLLRLGAAITRALREARERTERKRAQEALRASEQLARSHVEVMMRSLDVLATEAAPEKLIAEMLRIIGQRLRADGVTLWLRNPQDDSLRLHVMIENDKQVAPDPDHPYVKDPQAWKRNLLVQEILLTKDPVVCDDIEHDVRLGAEFREYLTNKGRKRFLAIPMFVLGEVRGFIGIQHVERGAYRPDEVELAQALAHHVMIATHEAELGEQRRHAVILEERTRMARDIHDTLAQGFTGVIIQLDTAVEALRDEEPEPAAKHIRGARELALQSLTEARRSVHALRPQALEKASFPDALKAIITNTTAGTSLQSDFQLKGEPRKLQSSVEENLLHIGQEALANALKHARATKFQARLSFDSEVVRLELRDNGQGFVVDCVNGRGIGLIGMKERAQQIGATLAVTSKPGKGTTIVAVLAYPAAVTT